jgi:hypothetical protein
MALQNWELQQRLSTVLPLSDGELTQIISHTDSLSVEEACNYFNDLLGDSPEAMKFIASYADTRRAPAQSDPDAKTSAGPGTGSAPQPLDKKNGYHDNRRPNQQVPTSRSNAGFAPPPGPPPNAQRPSHHERAMSYNHTNPVIEAARVRATDEVCSQFITRALEQPLI